MSKTVLISDLHGNAPSLEQVVEREGSDKEYLVLGDLMGLNAYPKETVELVQEVGDHIIAGNHDYALFHKGEGHVNSDELSAFELEHTMSELSDADKEWMRSLRHMKVMQRGPHRICMAHAMPWPSHASGYEPGNAGVSKGDVTQVAASVSNDYDYVFLGHSHEQYDVDCSKFGHDVTFVNPGSLGYDGTYSVVDLDSGEVEHKSVEYDKQAVEEHISEHLPDSAPPTRKWF